MPKFDKDTQPTKRGKGPKPGTGGGPPKLLQDYRWVNEHVYDATDDPARKLLQDVRINHSLKFLELHTGLERAYKGGALNSGVEVQPGADGGGKVKYDGTGPCPTCGQEPDPYAGMTPEALDELLEKEYASVDAFDAQRRVG